MAFMAGALSIAAEEAYGLRLADVAGQILMHAQNREGIVIEGESVPLVLDGSAATTRPQPHELLPGRGPNGDGP